MDSHSHLIKPIDLLKKAYQRFTGYFSKIFPVLITSYLGADLILLARSGQGTGIGFILALIGGVITLISYIAIMRILSDVHVDANDIVGNIKQSFLVVLPYIWVMILMAVVISGATLLLVVPGIIVGIFLCLSMFVFIVEKKRGISALVQSWIYVEGNWWAVFVRMLVYVVALIIVSMVLAIVFGSLGLITGRTPGHMSLGISLIQQLADTFFFMPFSLAYFYTLYMSLQEFSLHRQGGETAVESEKTARTWLTIFIVLGIIAIPIFIMMIVAALTIAAVTHPGVLSML